MTSSWRTYYVVVAALLLTLHQIGACPELHITSPLLPFIEGEYALGFYSDEETGDVLYSYNGRLVHPISRIPSLHDIVRAHAEKHMGTAYVTGKS